MAAERGISADDAHFYADELCFLHDGSCIANKDAWQIITSTQYKNAVHEYTMYKRFGMPRAGGWKDQSVVWIASVFAVGSAVQEIERAQLKKAARENKPRIH